MDRLLFMPLAVSSDIMDGLRFYARNVLQRLQALPLVDMSQIARVFPAGMDRQGARALNVQPISGALAAHRITVARQ